MIRLMRRSSVALALAVTLAVSPGCAVGNLLLKAPSAVQMVSAAADAVEAANKLGEVVIQLYTAAHKLKLAGVIPRVADDNVQRAASAFANDKDLAVAAMNKATTALELVASAAPLVGDATTITTALKGVQTVGLPGTAAVVASTFPSLLKQATDLIAQLGGPKS